MVRLDLQWGTKGSKSYYTIGSTTAGPIQV